MSDIPPRVSEEQLPWVLVAPYHLQNSVNVPRHLLQYIGGLARYLWTADSQFGFKRAHGTEMAIFSLNQTVYFYRNQDTPVNMCFLDAKKVFDRVNHWMLAKKLLNRNVPLHIVNFFIFWYRDHHTPWYDGVTHYQ